MEKRLKIGVVDLKNPKKDFVYYDIIPATDSEISYIEGINKNVRDVQVFLLDCSLIK